MLLEHGKYILHLLYVLYVCSLCNLSLINCIVLDSRYRDGRYEAIFLPSQCQSDTSGFPCEVSLIMVSRNFRRGFCVWTTFEATEILNSDISLKNVLRCQAGLYMKFLPAAKRQVKWRCFVGVVVLVLGRTFG